MVHISRFLLNSADCAAKKFNSKKLPKMVEKLEGEDFTFWEISLAKD